MDCNTFEKEKQSYIKRFLAFIFSVNFTIIFAFLIKYIAGIFFPDCVPENITEHFNLYVMDFRPENAEKIQFFGCLIFFPIIYMLFIKILDKVLVKVNNKLFNLIAFLEIIIPLLLTVFLCVNIDNDALNILYLGIKSPILYLAWAIISLLLIYLYEKANKKLKYTINTGIGLISAAVFYTIAKLYYTPTYDFSEASIMHFASYFSPVYKVYSGQTIGVDFTNLYGYYPYFYNIIFKIFNNASVSFFSLINSLLVCLSTFFVFITIFLNVKNKVLAFNFFLTYVYLYNFANIFSTHTLYFLQFMPHRIFFITFIMAFASLYTKIKQVNVQNIMKVIGYLISLLSILWNIESGLIVLFSWTLFLIYRQIEEDIQKGTKTQVNKFSIYVVAPIIVILSFLAIIKLITFAKSGVWTNTNSNFYYQTLFYKAGYYMLPMPLFKHPWLLIILTYLIALIRPINYLFNNQNKIEQDTAMFLLLSLCGLGIFVYYQGRSYILNLVGVSFPALIITALLCNTFIKNAFNNNIEKIHSSINIAKITLLLLPVLYFSISTVNSVFIKSPVPYFDLLKQNVSQNGSCINNYLFIKENTSDNEKIDILTIDADTLYSMLKRNDNLKFNTYIDWCDKAQYQKVFDYLQKSNNTLVIDRYVADNFKKYERTKFEKLFKEKGYVITAQNKDLYIIKQKMNKKSFTSLYKM